VAVIGPNGAGSPHCSRPWWADTPAQRQHIDTRAAAGHHLDALPMCRNAREVEWGFPVTVAEVVMMGERAFGLAQAPRETGPGGRRGLS